MFNIITRNKCCICNYNIFTEKILLKNIPVYCGTTDDKIEADIFHDQLWVECNNCGCLQLKYLLPLDMVYKENHNLEPVGNIWKKHHEKFLKFIIKNKQESILEIGGASGYLAEKFLNINSKINYLIIEPNSKIKNSKIKLINGYIEDNLNLISDYNCIVHSHVLEHIYSPAEFINNLSNRMQVGQKMFISVPNIKKMILSEGLNALNFEHTYMLTKEHLEIIFNNAGFKIKKQKNFLSHSHFYYLEKINKNKKNLNFINISKNSNEFVLMIKKIYEFVNLTNSLLNSNNSKNVYIFGAHVFSQNLISFGLKTENIKNILDNSKQKQEKRLYGNNLIVKDPSIIKNIDSPIVILKASQYQKEIKNQLIKLNKSVKIIE